MPRSPMRAVEEGGLAMTLSVGTVMTALPRERVDAALEETGTASVRNRLLPAPVVFYLVVMLAMFAEASVRENLRILLEPLRRRFGRQKVTVPTGGAITKARKRLGPAPFTALFEALARPLGKAKTPGCFWKGYRVVAADATSVETQDTEANRRRFGRHVNQHGPAGYPQIKLAVLVECGTRVPLGCAWGGADAYELAIFDPLREKVAKDMLFLADRGYYSFERWQDCAKRAGALLWRVKKNMVLQPIRRFADGSYLAEVRPSFRLVRQGLSRQEESALVRVVEYRPVFVDGTEGEMVRLLTTLLEPQGASAEQLARLYTDRWEIETGFDELKTHLRGPDRVLRSQVPELVEQELYGFLLAYYAVRATMAEAARRAACPPSELSFIHAVRVVRRRVSFPPGERN